MITDSAVWLALLGLFAGGVGALAGVGGGIIITPVLAIYFGVPMHQAIGASLVAVIATSSATSAVYVDKHVADLRLGMTLELATTLGAGVAAVVAGYVDRRTLALLFTLFLLYTAIALVRRAWSTRKDAAQAEIPAYKVERYGFGLGASLIAGGLSGLLGIGGGPVKVPVMYLFMKVPLRVATATSNLMIGVTAASSAYVYYGRGDVVVPLVAPLVAGVFAGSLAGARLSHRVRGAHVMLLLVAITAYLAAQMGWKLWSGSWQ
jgi:hypothetical protein